MFCCMLETFVWLPILGNLPKKALLSCESKRCLCMYFLGKWLIWDTHSFCSKSLQVSLHWKAWASGRSKRKTSSNDYVHSSWILFHYLFSLHYLFMTMMTKKWENNTTLNLTPYLLLHKSEVWKDTALQSADKFSGKCKVAEFCTLLPMLQVSWRFQRK